MNEPNIGCLVTMVSAACGGGGMGGTAGGMGGTAGGGGGVVTAAGYQPPAAGAGTDNHRSYRLPAMAVVIGAALLVVALLGSVATLRVWPLWRVLRTVRPATLERLVAAAHGGRLDGRVVAVSGVAAPGDDGALVAVVSGDACVWHRHTVHRRQIRYRTTASGVSQRASLPRLVGDTASTEPFALRPALG